MELAYQIFINFSDCLQSCSFHTIDIFLYKNTPIMLVVTGQQYIVGVQNCKK
jgi:hypothetical protein